MSENKNPLKRIDDYPGLPDLLNKLDKEKQEKYIEKHVQNVLDIDKMQQEKVLKSKVAEHDLAVAQDNLRGLDQSKKFYTHNQTVETGSGKIEIKVKGGDTKFIIPIVAVVGIILITILAIIFL